VELTPGERAMLGQLKALHASTSKRELSLTAITSQWPAMHLEAYKGVLRGLVEKKLLEGCDKGRSVRITDAGALLMGIADTEETKTIDLRILAKERHPAARKPEPASPAPGRLRAAEPQADKRFGRRIGLLAIAAAAILAAWWLF
jgi:hypothetical protein